MALQQLPGRTGFLYSRVSSMDGRAIGKFTDSNHLETLRSDAPADYDKKLIQLYTQSSLYANDFLEMINQAEPFYIRGNTDSWKWDVEVPYKFPVIIEIPSDTANMSRPGIDGQEFQIVVDRGDEFTMNQIITPHKMHGPQWFLVKDPEPWFTGWLLTLTLVTENPKVDFVSKTYLQPGIDLLPQGGAIGEFDQTLLGLPGMGEKITMFESLGAAIGMEHTITGWADDKRIGTDNQGRALDLLMFTNRARNITPGARNVVRWEPFVEAQMRMAMMDKKVEKMIWAKPGTAKTRGSKQEVKKVSAGVIHRMRTNGNLLQYPKGQFTINYFRSIFGDLFYRRVDISRRRVKIYTNEAGFDTFSNAAKEDAFNSGLQIVADSRFIQGSGRNLVLNYEFNSVVTRETGEITLVHLKELDLPQTNLEFGQNKKSPPIYMVFDVSPDGNGTFRGNIREVRHEGRPSMTWGYIDGRRHHLGFAASKGHSAGSKFDGYTIFMDDRYDVFIEDLSRTVLIEELPIF